MKRNDVFEKLKRELKRKNISKEEIKEAEKEINGYISNLQKEVSFKLDISLKKFIEARR